MVILESESISPLSSWLQNLTNSPAKFRLVGLYFFMAIFRKIHTSFWSDSFIQDLDKDQKLFYLYLLTNERTRQCGIYEITKKQISYDLGYTMDRVSILLDYFIKTGKIRYNDVTKEIAIGNWLKYNSSTSHTVQACINKEFKLVKDTVLIEYVQSMDTHPQEEEEQEQEEKKEEEKGLAAHAAHINYKKQSEMDFINEMRNFEQLYSRDMLNTFYQYWSERDAKGMMRFQREKTWELDKRLMRWKSKQKEYGKSGAKSSVNDFIEKIQTIKTNL